MVIGSKNFEWSSPIEGFVDANFDTPSTTGFVILAMGSVIHVESRKQNAITKHTTEAELVAASQCAEMVIYLRRMLIEDFGLNIPTTPIAEDNEGCIAIAEGGGNHKRRRHIRVADSWIYQEVSLTRNIRLYPISSRDNIADMFTKSLESPAFIRFRDKLMGMENPTTRPYYSVPQNEESLCGMVG